jgi:hypothetical protein
MMEINVVLQIGTMIIIGVVGFYVRGTNNRINEIRGDFIARTEVVFKELEKKQDKAVCLIQTKSEERERDRIATDLNGVGSKLSEHIQAGKN